MAGALLDRSETMIVLLDETYFTRLWCAASGARPPRKTEAGAASAVPL